MGRLGARAATWNGAAASHVLRRVGFGGSRATVARAVEQGLEATVDEWTSRRADAAASSSERAIGRGDLTTLQARWMAGILDNEAPLVERVTLMWHNHFATSNAKVGDAALMDAQIELLRSKGLGDFRELLHAIAKDPAMLVWLDGNQNRVGQPNENFAREVMELFGLGIGGGYTEADIQEAARAFSGHGVANGQHVFRPEHHDTGEKMVLGKGGVFSAEDAIDRVLAHPECSRWIARRLLVTFVLPEPDRATIEAWAEVLVDEEWNIGATLARLFRSDLFLSDRARRSRIAGPVELVAYVTLVTDSELGPLDAARAAGVMGQTLCMPPSVKGWDGGRAWIDPGSWLARHNWLTDFALAKGLDAKKAFGAASREGAPEAVCRVLLPDGASEAMLEQLARAARSAHSDGHALHKVAALVLTSPEFHLV